MLLGCSFPRSEAPDFCTAYKMCLCLLLPTQAISGWPVQDGADTAELNVFSENLTLWDSQYRANPGFQTQCPHIQKCHTSITEPFRKWCWRKAAWFTSSLRKRILEIKFGKTTQGLSALEGSQTEFLTKRLHSKSWKIVSLLFWGDKRTTFRETGCPTAAERWRKGTGSSCQSCSPAPYSSPCLGSTCNSGFPGGFQGSCSTADQQLWQKTDEKYRPCRAEALLLSTALAVHRKSEL